MNDRIASTAVPRGMRDVARPSVVGVARALDYMVTMRRAAELALTNPEIDESDGHLFVRRVARIVRWRFSVNLPRIHDRFVQVASIVFDMAESALDLASPPHEAKDIYLKLVNDILEEWNSWGGSVNTLSP